MSVNQKEKQNFHIFPSLYLKLVECLYVFSEKSQVSKNAGKEIDTQQLNQQLGFLVT